MRPSRQQDDVESSIIRFNSLIIEWCNTRCRAKGSMNARFEFKQFIKGKSTHSLCVKTPGAPFPQLCVSIPVRKEKTVIVYAFHHVITNHITRISVAFFVNGVDVLTFDSANCLRVKHRCRRTHRHTACTVSLLIHDPQPCTFWVGTHIIALQLSRCGAHSFFRCLLFSTPASLKAVESSSVPSPPPVHSPARHLSSLYRPSPEAEPGTTPPPLTDTCLRSTYCTVDVSLGPRDRVFHRSRAVLDGNPRVMMSV